MTRYAFGAFVLDVSERRLTVDGRKVGLPGKTLDVLRLLVEADGRLVERETFNARLWSDVTVEDRNLTVQISTLRKVLKSPDCIETVAKAGYRLAVPVRALAPRHDRPATSMRPLPAEAALLQLEARAHLARRERVSALKALGLFERALALNPHDPTAHAGLASTYLFLASTVVRRPLPIDEAKRLACEAASRARALDERNGEAQAVLGEIKMVLDWDWRGAESDLAQAVAAAPESVEAAAAYGWFMCAMGRHEAAIEALKRARQLDPLLRETIERLGLAYWMGGAADQAVATLADAAAIDPEARRPHFRSMVVLDQLGRHEEATAARAEWLRLYDDPAAAARLTGLARDGRWRDAMLDWIGMLEKQNQWFEAALQWMVIDEPGRALDALERCVTERGTSSPFLMQYPSFRPLHQKPRFRRLAGILGLDDGGSQVVRGPSLRSR